MRALTSGELVSEGQLGYMSSSDGLVYITDADAESSSKGLLVYAPMDADEEEISFILEDIITMSGLTPGATYYLSEASGGKTTTKPSTGGTVVRILGYALTTTQFYFKPSQYYTVN